MALICSAVAIEFEPHVSCDCGSRPMARNAFCNETASSMQVRITSTSIIPRRRWHLFGTALLRSPLSNPLLTIFIPARALAFFLSAARKQKVFASRGVYKYGVATRWLHLLKLKLRRVRCMECYVAALDLDEETSQLLALRS
jgi:hypothetical protein